MYQIGYTTGTFDLTHQGHFEILKKCKFYCQKLIVGLVSDETWNQAKKTTCFDLSASKRYFGKQQICRFCSYI